MHETFRVHRKRLTKREEDEHFCDSNASAEKYPTTSAVLMDKERQSAAKVLQAIILKKKPAKAFWNESASS